MLDMRKRQSPSPIRFARRTSVVLQLDTFLRADRVDDDAPPTTTC
jgi:hypothetical protein